VYKWTFKEHLNYFIFGIFYPNIPTYYDDVKTGSILNDNASFVKFESHFIHIDN